MWRRQQQALLRLLPSVKIKTPAAWAGGGMGHCNYGSEWPEGRKGKTAPLQVSSHNSPIPPEVPNRHPPACLTEGYC